jgi:flagellar export protein FliJ
MAGKTKFRLEPVLEHRKRLADEARQEFAARSREYQSAVDALQELQQERVELLALVGRMQTQGQIDVTALAAAESCDLRLRLMADAQEQSVMAAELRAEQARCTMVEKHAGQRALELLRDRHIEDQIRRLRVHEEKMIDEMATIRHALRGTEGGAGGLL